MTYTVMVLPLVKSHIIRHQHTGNKKLVIKILSLLEELRLSPRIGTGKPEQLKGYIRETWSRKIDSKHRLLYEIQDQELVVIAISAYGHYGDK